MSTCILICLLQDSFQKEILGHFPLRKTSNNGGFTQPTTELLTLVKFLQISAREIDFSKGPGIFNMHKPAAQKGPWFFIPSKELATSLTPWDQNDRGVGYELLSEPGFYPTSSQS